MTLANAERIVRGVWRCFRTLPRAAARDGYPILRGVELALGCSASPSEGGDK